MFTHWLNQCCACDRLPAHTPISSDCKDLLRKIFLPSPEQRITIQGIQRHPWFEKNLPQQVKNQDWNSQYIQHVDAAARAATIRQTVHAALGEPLMLDSDIELDAPTLHTAYEDGTSCDNGHFQAVAYHSLQY